MQNWSLLTRWSSVSVILGGLLFPIGIALHPLRHGEAVNASPYSAIHVLIAVALMLILLGLLGLYGYQAERLGRSGIYSFILAFVGTLWTYGLLITEGFMWPAVGQYDPAAIHDFNSDVAEAHGGSLWFIFFVGLALFALGYTLFGRATMRAGVLPRWSGALVAIGAVLYVVGGFSLPLFGPESLLVTIIETSGAVPFGLGLIKMGYVLWTGSGNPQRTALGISR